MAWVSESNLKNSLSQFKGKVDESFNTVNTRLSKLNYAQKVTEEGELEYLYATSTFYNSTKDNVALKAGVNIFTYLTEITTSSKENISVDDDHILNLKAGYKYKVTISLSTTQSNVAYYLVDSTANITSSAVAATVKKYGNRGYASRSEYSAENIVAVVDATNEYYSIKCCVDRSSQFYPSDSYLLVEVLNPMSVSPIEYIDESKGIEYAPVGHIISFMGNNPPKHYIACDGNEYNIDDYKYLTKHFKDEFGSINYFGGDGETTFAVPDLRGEFLRGSSDSLVVGEYQDGTKLTYYRKPNDSHGFFSDAANVDDGTSETKSITRFGTSSSSLSTTKITGDVRPTNTSVLYCIKYEPTYYMQVNTSLESSYSYDEQQIGYWVDGRPLYQKTLYIESLPNAVSASYDPEIDNLDFFTDAKGIAKNKTNKFTFILPFNAQSTTKSAISFQSDSGSTMLVINAGYDRREYEGYITIQYVKTTD